MFRVLSIVTLVLSLIMLTLFILFVLGMSTISHFWGGGGSTSDGNMFVFGGILLLVIPIFIIIIGDVFLRKIGIVNNVLKVVAFIICFSYIVISILVFQDFRKESTIYKNEQELKEPENFLDNKENSSDATKE